jgi:hypothetical protein
MILPLTLTCKRNAESAITAACSPGDWVRRRAHEAAVLPSGLKVGWCAKTALAAR